MPKPKRTSIKAASYADIERFHVPFEYANSRLSELEVEAALRKFGLLEYEISLIMARFVEEMPVADIALKDGWVNRDSANYYIRAVLKKLRDGGFRC